tara:strand:- start:2654 stop:3559 length:906 start_codon:yes stop_codon:yes gene_type:complete
MTYDSVMELYQLRGFARVARGGTLTRAAEELHITQPALSSQIRALEDEFGVQLFERRGRGLALTTVGQTLLSRAEQILELAEHAARELSDTNALKDGTLNIGTNDSNSLQVLPDLLVRFRADYPGVRIRLFNSHSSQVAVWVEDGTVEIGIVTLPLTHRTLVSHPLYERDDVLIVPPGHDLESVDRIAPRDLEAYPFLFLHRGSVSHDRLMEELRRESYGPTDIMQVGSLEVVKRYVELGLGISIVPMINVQHEVRSGRLVARSLPWIPRNVVGVVQRKSAYLSPAANEFVRRLVDHTAPE